MVYSILAPSQQNGGKPGSFGWAVSNWLKTAWSCTAKLKKSFTWRPPHGNLSMKTEIGLLGAMAVKILAIGNV